MKAFLERNAPLLALWRRELAGYNVHTLRRDLLAGLTVGAVALPLALAFGVASSASPAAGLVTAIVAGLLIAALGGSPSQISGPTGAMSAILIGLASRYGLEGIWAATVIAGLLLILLGLLRLGHYIHYIPSPVIAGFTLGIALIIAVGQLDHVLGVTTPPTATTLARLTAYLAAPIHPDWRTIATAAVVILTMILLPRLTTRIPGSLVGITLATVMAHALAWPVPVIGAIPSTLLLEQRFTFERFSWASVPDLLAPAVAIAALGAIESLLCGAVAKNMSGKPIDNNQELIAQGVGNVVIPFFGGVPATAAIARTSVNIKSGGETRLASIIHALLLLLSALLLGPIIGEIPLAALGGVLLVTAWRMNEWETIRFAVRTGLKHIYLPLAATALATILLDLTQAILVGTALSAVIYLVQSARTAQVIPAGSGASRADGALPGPAPEAGQPAAGDLHVYRLVGPLFFGSVSGLMNQIERLGDGHGTVILDMQGVPTVDIMGIKVLEHFVLTQQRHGAKVLLTNIQHAVHEMFHRSGFVEFIGADHIVKDVRAALRASQQQGRLSESGRHAHALPFATSEAMIESDLPADLVSP